VSPLSIDQFQVEHIDQRPGTPLHDSLFEGGDLVRMLSLENNLGEADVRLTALSHRAALTADGAPLSEDYFQRDRLQGETVVRKTDSVTFCAKGQLPRAVVFRDSFGIALAPFLAEYFGKSVFVWDRRFDRELVAREKPSVVIYEVVERALMDQPFHSAAE
jgi:hypothetical protein